jgi:hypothetical protein
LLTSPTHPNVVRASEKRDVDQVPQLLAAESCNYSTLPSKPFRLFPNLGGTTADERNPVASMRTCGSVINQHRLERDSCPLQRFVILAIKQFSDLRPVG